jgi:hypothetical protein
MIIESCSEQLLPRIAKATPENYFKKKTLIYFSKIIPRNYLSSKYIFINIIIKLQSYTS